MKKLSILQLVSISEEWGGVEQHVKDLTEGLYAEGHQVLLAIKPSDKYIDGYSKVSCPVYQFSFKGAADVTTIRGLAQLIRNNKIDIIHSHTSRDAWLGLFATFLAGRGQVVTTRHVPFKAKRDIIHTWFYNQLAAIICVSKFVRRSFLGNSSKIDTHNVKVIYPGVDFDKFHSSLNSNANSADNDEFLIGFIGRITKEKGIHDLIEAVHLLNLRNRKCKLMIVGGVNPETPSFGTELKLLCTKLGLENIVHFIGFSDDVPTRMKMFDTLVLPSVSSETFGLVLVEALCLGIPVIATNTGAQDEIIQDTCTGFLVPPMCPAELASAIELLLLDKLKARQMGQLGKEYVLANFGKAKMISDHIQCFQAIVENKNTQKDN